MQPPLPYPARESRNSEPEDGVMQLERTRPPQRIRQRPGRLPRRRCRSHRRPCRVNAVVSFAASIFLLMVIETSRLLRRLPPQHNTALFLFTAASSASSSSSGPHPHRRRQQHTHAKKTTANSHKTTSKKQQQDYYELLGADKHCTPDQLKKCYRRACLRHHPDKGGNEDTFKRVSRAYQVLSDPQQRKLYDALGEAGLDQQYQQAGGAGAGNPFAGGGGPFFGGDGGPSPFSSFSFGSTSSTFGGGGGEAPPSFGGPQGGGVHINLDDLLREFMMMGGGGGGGATAAGGGAGADAFFSQAGRRQRPNASSPAVYERPVYCSLEDLYRGASKKLKVSFNKHKQVSQLYSIHILPGYKAGTKLTFPATNSCPRMVFVIQERPHPIFERRGDDLVYRYKLQPPSDGRRIHLSIPLLDGTTWTREIDTTSNRLVRRGGSITVPDLGMPVRRRASTSTSAATNKKTSNPPPPLSQRGNLIIEFE